MVWEVRTHKPGRGIRALSDITKRPFFSPSAVPYALWKALRVFCNLVMFPCGWLTGWVLAANVRIRRCSNPPLVAFQTEWNKDEWLTGRDVRTWTVGSDGWQRTWKTLFAFKVPVIVSPPAVSWRIRHYIKRRCFMPSPPSVCRRQLFFDSFFLKCQVSRRLTANEKKSTFFVQHAHFCALNTDYATVLFQVFSCCD